MKKLATALCSTGLVVLFAHSALAQCSFDLPGKAKGLKTSFARHFAGCPSITFASPNTSTMAGTPACGAPYALSSYQWGNLKGGCSLKTSHKFEKKCKANPAGSCTNVLIKAKCKGMRDSSNSPITPLDPGNWGLNTVARATIDDPDGGDMTVIDFPAQFTFDIPKSGQLKLTSSTNDLLFLLFGPGNVLPACTGLQLLSVAIVDPQTNTFATMGSMTSAKFIP